MIKSYEQEPINNYTYESKERINQDLLNLQDLMRGSQDVWTLSLLVTVVNASDSDPRLEAQDIIGWIMWPMGLSIEATSNQQSYFLKIRLRIGGNGVNGFLYSDVLKELMSSFPNLLITTDSSNSTDLHTPADVVNLLLDADSNLAKIARNNGKIVLHTVARMGHLEVAKSVLNKDPSIGFKIDNKWQTALHMAVKGQNMDIVVELIKPDPTVFSLDDDKGNTALHIAIKESRTKVL